MIQNLIKEHILKLTIEDIDKFGKENNIHLSYEELNNVYNIIKNNWYDLIYGDSNSVFENNRFKINDENYKKAKELFEFFKKKYQRFL